jgi:hypothetical protein
LLRKDGSSLFENDDSGGSLDAAIEDYILPEDGLYLIQATGIGSDDAYTLSLEIGVAAPVTIDVPVTSTTQITSLWQFDGHTGQLVNISLAGSSPSFDPYLTLLSPTGAKLVEDDDSGEGYNSYDAQIADFLLPQDGLYSIVAGRPGSSAPYTLTLNTTEPLTIGVDSLAPLSQGRVWRFAGQAGQTVYIRTVGLQGEAAGFTLVLPNGEGMLEAENSLLADLSSSGVYLLIVRTASTALANAWLSIDDVGRSLQAVGGSEVISGVLHGFNATYWTVPGDRQHAVVITATGATTALRLDLYDPDNELLGTVDSEATEDSDLLLYGRPLTGTYTLAVGGTAEEASGVYTLTVGWQEVNPLQPPLTCFPTRAGPWYGPVAVGSLVILGRHRPMNGNTSWNEDMARYVGKFAHVQRLAAVDEAGCPVVEVDIDQGRFYWRIRDLILVR